MGWPSVGIGDTDLTLLWRQLLAERHDREMGARRRLEALAGFDPDEAPDGLIASLQGATAEAGHDAVDEIAAAAKARSPQTLRDILDRARESRQSIRVVSPAMILSEYSRQDFMTKLPWQRAETTARLAREVWGIDHGPVSNRRLSELFDVPESFLGYTPANGPPIGAGFRTDPESDTVNVVMRARVVTGRRFEITRLVADHIVAPSGDRLLPITGAKTDRQKFQRAFAQEFLLPFDELHERLGRPRPSDDISDEDIDDVAQEYEVSPLLIRTALVNRGVLPRAAPTAS